MSANIGRVEREIFTRSLFPVRISDSMASALANSMRLQSFEAGETIYREGNAAELVFFVVAGDLELITEGDAPWKFGERAVVGILDAVLRRPYSRTAVAKTDVDVLTLRSDAYFEILEDSFEDQRRMMRTVSYGLHELGQKLGPEETFSGVDGRAPVLTPTARALHTVERMMVLSDVPHLANAPMQAIVGYAKRSHEQRWEPGDVVYEQGQALTSYWFSVTGAFEILRDGEPLGVRFGPSQILGGFVVFAYDEHFHTVRATAPSVTLRVEVEDFIDGMEDHFFVSQSLFRHLTFERIRIQSMLAEAGIPVD